VSGYAVRGEKKSGINVPLFAPDKETRIESLWQRTFLIPDALHHGWIALNIGEMESDLHLVHFRFLERGSGADKQQTSWKDRSSPRTLVRISASFSKISAENTWIFADCQVSAGTGFDGSAILRRESEGGIGRFCLCFPDNPVGEPCTCRPDVSRCSPWNW